MDVLPGAEPFRASGGRTGVLLCHGFTSTPQSLRPWAEHLAAAGLTVELPLLPGHGTTWQDLAATRWPQWYGELDRALTDLQARCDAVFVMGLSMGGTLALRLAQVHGERIRGVAVVNTSLATERWDLRLGLPVLRFVVPSRPGIGGDIRAPGVTELAYDRVPLKALWSLRELWGVVRRDLPLVRQPLLVARSTVDHVVEPVSGRVLLAGVGSSDVRELELADSYHVATLDNDAPALFAASLEFVRELTARPDTASAAGSPA